MERFIAEEQLPLSVWQDYRLAKVHPNVIHYNGTFYFISSLPKAVSTKVLNAPIPLSMAGKRRVYSPVTKRTRDSPLARSIQGVSTSSP